MTLFRRSKATAQTSTSLCAITRSVPVNSTVALYNDHSTRQGQGGGCHCSVAETGLQQSDRADDREDPQVQHIEIKEVPRSSTLTR